MRVIPRQLPLALEPATGYSIDDFVVTASNQAAFELLESWPCWPSPVVVLAGPAGAGKSHLAAVWAAQSFAQRFEPARLEPAIKATAHGVPILLEDMTAKKFDETELFHLINAVRQARIDFPQSSLLITADCRPACWQVSLPDLASRLKAVSLIELEPPDEAMLRAVIIKLFADRQVAVEPQIVNYIVNRVERALDKAADLVQRIDHAALEKRSKITRQLVADVLEKMKRSDEAGNGA